MHNTLQPCLMHLGMFKSENIKLPYLVPGQAPLEYQVMGYNLSASTLMIRPGYLGTRVDAQLG